MNEKIKLVKSNGTTVEGDIICFIEDTTTSKRYVYYTLNELVNAEPSQNIKIYIAKIKQNNMTDVPISEEEWGKLKAFMGDVLKNVDNPNVKYIPQNELVDPTIIDEKVIAMPTMYDYISKHRGVYANKIASLVSEPQPTLNISDNVAPEIAPASVEPPVAETISPVVESPIVPEATPITPETLVEETSPTNEPQIMTPEIAPMEQNVPVSGQPIEEHPVVEKPEPIVTSQILEKIDIASIEKKYDAMLASITELKNKELEAANRYNATLELNAMHNAQHANYVQNEQEPQVESTQALEPTPVEPVSIEPETTNVNPEVNIETNWFDMQPQG